MILSFLRAVFLYLVLFAVIRMMGKRELGQMEPTEFVVALLAADLAAIPMQDISLPLYSGLVPLLTILGMELLLSCLCLKSIRIRRLLCGKPVILIDNGKLLPDNLRRTRITIDELTEQLREKDVLDLQSVQYAILETNGNLSVFPFPEYLPASAKSAGIRVPKQSLPITIIEDGCLLTQNLPLANKDLSWVRSTLQSRNARIRNTWLLTVDSEDHVLWLRKEEGK